MFAHGPCISFKTNCRVGFRASSVRRTGSCLRNEKNRFLRYGIRIPLLHGISPFVAHYGTERSFFMSENKTTSEKGGLSREERSRRMKLISLAGLFIAVEIVTEYYLSFTVDNQYRVSLTSLIRAVAGFTVGFTGAVVSVLADLIGGFIKYGGGLIPPLTVVRGLQGLTHGLFLYKRMNTARIVSAAVISTFLLNALGLVARYTYLGTPLNWTIATPSLTVYAITTVAEIFVVSTFRLTLVPRIQKMMYNAGVWKGKESKQVSEEQHDA